MAEQYRDECTASYHYVPQRTITYLSNQGAMTLIRRTVQDHAKLRLAVEAYLAESGVSLRELGARLGVSHALLSRFLAGAGLRPATARRIRDWLAEPDEAEVAQRVFDDLRRLLGPFGERRTKPVLAVLARIVEDEFSGAGKPVPTWLRSVRRR